MNLRHDTATPTLSVIDPRALAIRSVGYCRHPDRLVIEPRITRQVFDEAGRLAESWDPRLWGTAPKPNLTTTFGLSGQPLSTDSVDAGWQLSLLNQAGSVRSVWDERGSQRHNEFDQQQRPIAVTEQALGESPNVVERLTYAGDDQAFAQHNQCGQLIRHDDPAGSQLFNDYGLAGAVLVESRRFLTELETPDWPLEPDARDGYLEAQSFVTRHSFNPTGQLRRQTDAMGNVRTFHHDVAGKPCEAWLLQSGEGKQPQCLVSDIRYNAHDQIESETAGNGVITLAEYGADDGRLLRLVAGVANQKPLQDLNYAYDPVGNIVELQDQSQTVTHFNNQRIDPISRYRYDSLYQLVEAKGWEVATPSHGPALPRLLPTPLDPNQRRNYTQTFDYDPAGNLITRHHSGATGFSMFTSARSNRSLAQRDDGSLPDEADVALGFDAGGNQLELQRGQAMVWDLRNQLSRVTLVKRESEPDDYEGYVYDRPGHRLRKTQFSQTSGRTLNSEVRYLPGLEIHRGTDGEERHVINVDAGRNSVRALHWPDGVHADHLRYSLSDHLGSGTLELDNGAGVLTQEHYYPFGGTACWAGKSVLVAQYKTIRYSGKERDVTGLYYYGYRYYAPWLQRWVSPDPAGTINGLNIFCFVANNPVTLEERDGRFYEGQDDHVEKYFIDSGKMIVARGLEQFPPHLASALSSQLTEIEHVFSDAKNALVMDVSGNIDILKSYFGSEYESIKSKLFDAWSRGQNLAKNYQSPIGFGKFIGFIAGPGHSRAEVKPDDFHGRLAIDMSWVNDEFSLILGHEMMHLKRANRIAAVGPGAVDNFYLSSDIPETLNYPVMRYDMPSQDVSEVIMSGGLTLEYLNSFPDDHRDFIYSVGNYIGLSDAMDIESSISMFNLAPHMRADMAVNNADSIVYAAKSMSRLYQARQADIALFNTPLYG